MLYRTLSSLAPRRVNTGPIFLRPALVLLLGLLLAKAPLRAQEAGTPVPDSDKQTIQLLLQRIEKLEARVTQLEAGKGPSLQPAVATTVASSTSPNPPAASPAAEPEPHQEQERSTSSPNAWT